jgi:hypothetical protein
MGAAAAFVLATGCGANAAVSGPTHDGGRVGVVVGRVVFQGGNAHGVVKVFNAGSRLVAHHRVRPDRSQFRFSLKPGRYVVRLTPARRWFLCTRTAYVRVRVGKTTSVKLGTPCGSY